MVKNIFIGGSRISQLCCDGKLPDPVCARLKNMIDEEYHILIGDANGVDKMVQDYLRQRGYKKVTVYYSGDRLRNKADDSWDTKHIPIDATGKKLNGYEVQKLKDKKMVENADAGYMIWADTYTNKRFGNKCVSKGTLSNIFNLLFEDKPVVVYYIPERRECVIESSDDFKNKLWSSVDQRTRKKWDELLKKQNKQTLLIAD